MFQEDENDEDIDRNQMFHFYWKKYSCRKHFSSLHSHFIHKGERHFKENYLKLTRSRNLNYKQFQILPTCIVFPPDEVFNTSISTWTGKSSKLLINSFIIRINIISLKNMTSGIFFSFYLGFYWNILLLKVLCSQSTPERLFWNLSTQK